MPLSAGSIYNLSLFQVNNLYGEKNNRIGSQFFSLLKREMSVTPDYWFSYLLN